MPIENNYIPECHLRYGYYYYIFITVFTFRKLYLKMALSQEAYIKASCCDTIHLFLVGKPQYGISCLRYSY